MTPIAARPPTAAMQHTSPWPDYVWPEGKRSAFCFSVDVDADSPLLWSLRDQPASRLMGHLEQRAFGPRVGIWRLLDLLSRCGIHGSFFVPASVAERHPQLLPAFVERGHEIGLHGYFHEIVAHVSDAEFTGALDASLELFHRQVGITPKGFRSPAWEMTPHMLAEVKKRGMYDSSLSGFDNPYTLGGVVEVPVQWAIDDAVFFKFLGGGGDQWPPVSPGNVLDIWQSEWQGLHDAGGLLMLTVHDWVSGRAHRIQVLETLIERVRQSPGSWIATVGEVAAHHANSVNRGRFEVPVATPPSIATQRFAQGS
ncbi:MAG: polysaccharide deacetylase family protein [Variovorax sp.]